MPSEKSHSTAIQRSQLNELRVFPFKCANCSVIFTDTKLFCRVVCSDEASWVRYARRCRADGRDQDAKVAEVIKIRLAHILSGGYDKVARRIPENIRRTVVERDGGRCQTCGGPGDEIDHIHGSSSDPINLQLLCDACHNKKTVAALKRITKDSHPAEWAAAKWLRQRATAPSPLLPCDSENWANIQKDLMRVRRDVVSRQRALFD